MDLSFLPIGRQVVVMLDGRRRGFLERCPDGLVRYYPSRSTPQWLKDYARTQWEDIFSARVMLSCAVQRQAYGTGGFR